MKILVAMSGGVDSSVAALMLREAGHDVVGMTLRVHDDPVKKAREKSCCAPRDIVDARDVAQEIGIPYYVVDMREDFRKHVMEPFASEYLSGRTPNPCVHCNSYLKFGLLFQRAKALGMEAVATGHYARRLEEHGEAKLLRGRDRDKDQSYFLFGLTPDQIARAYFPLGDMTKSEVRQRAAHFGIPTADKPESQEICFVPDGHYAKVVSDLFPEAASSENTSGRFIDRDGRRLGEHSGFHQYTVGQRKGLGISHPRPLYVTGIHPKTRDVQVGTEEELMRERFDVRQVNWLTKKMPERCQVSIRYRHQAQPATLTSGQEPNLVHVTFETAQRAIAPGQAAVFYDGDRVLGGGWIA